MDFLQTGAIVMDHGRLCSNALISKHRMQTLAPTLPILPFVTLLASTVWLLSLFCHLSVSHCHDSVTCSQAFILGLEKSSVPTNEQWRLPSMMATGSGCVVVTSCVAGILVYWRIGQIASDLGECGCHVQADVNVSRKRRRLFRDGTRPRKLHLHKRGIELVTYSPELTAHILFMFQSTEWGHVWQRYWPVTWQRHEIRKWLSAELLLAVGS